MNWFTNIFKSRTLPKEDLGVHGVQHIGGFLQEEEKSASLRGEARYKTFSNMLANTTIVSAGVRYYLNLLSKSGLVFEPGPGDTDGVKAKLFEDMLQNMETPWHRVIRRAGMYRFYGFSIQEWTAFRRPEDGIIALRDIAPRPQRTILRWGIDSGGKVTGCYQTDPNFGKEIFLPRNRILYILDDSLNDSPEGLGIFRHLVKTAERLTRYEQLEGYGFESDLRGVPIAKAPLAELNRKLLRNEITPEQMSAYLAPIKKFLASHIKTPRLGMLIDSAPYSSQDDAATPSLAPQWVIELLKGSPTSLEQNNAAIERINLEMARLMGVEHLLIGGDGKGSMALSQDKSHNFALIVESSQKEISSTICKDIRDPIWALNGWDDDTRPKIKPEPIRFRDPEQITGAILDLARSGDLLEPDDPVINTIRDMLGLPPKPAELIERGLALNEEPDDEDEDSGESNTEGEGDKS